MLSEHDRFQGQIIERAHALGLLVHHSTDPVRDIGPGFPDLFIAGPFGYVFAELKTPRGKMRPEQVTWQYRLLAAHAPYVIWTPANWPEIEEFLHGLAA